MRDSYSVAVQQLHNLHTKHSSPRMPLFGTELASRAQTGEDAVELVRGLEARMKAAVQDLRTEFLQKLSVITK